MTPLHQWIAVLPEDRVTASYIYVPAHVPQNGEFRVGTVQAVGEGVPINAHRRQLEVKAGERIIYSARIDTYRIGDAKVDLVEEGSVLGHV